MKRKGLLLLFNIFAISFLSCGKNKSKSDNNQNLALALALSGNNSTEEAKIEVKGTIYDNSGNTATDATLTVSKETSSSVRSTTAVTTSTTTDSNGEFTIYLRLGRYKITVTQSDGSELGSFVIEAIDLENAHLQATDAQNLVVIITSAIVISDNTDLLFGYFTFDSFTDLVGASNTYVLIEGVTTDPFGNIYMYGLTTGSLDGNTQIGSYDVFVTKYNSQGTKQWTKQYGEAGAVTYTYSDIDVDSFGNLYVTGEIQDGGLNGNTQIGTRDAFLMKLDTSGNEQWTKQIGVSGTLTAGSGVAVDDSNNVYLVGTTGGNLDGNTKNGDTDLFVMKFDTSGNKQWTKLSGTSGASVDTNGGSAITTDSSGNVYATGSIDGGLDGNSLTGTKDVFVIKYDSGGNKQWTKQTGVSGVNTSGYGITVDSPGNIYVTGNTGGGLDGNSITGNSDVFVIKYDSSGNKQWTKQLGVSSKNTTGYDIIADVFGNFYIVGETDGGLNGNTYYANGTYKNDMFVLKYDSSGNLLWSKQMGSSGESTSGKSIDLDSLGNPIVVGNIDSDGDGGTFDGISISGYIDAVITTKFGE